MEYQLKLEDRDLAALDQVLQEAPYKIAAPLFQKINAQLDAQNKAAAEAAKSKEGAEC